MAELNEKGQEVLDNKPVVLDVSPRPLPLVDRIKQAVRHELSEKARNSGYESFEEANDFDIEDEFAEMDHISGYEVEEMTEEFPNEARLASTGQSEATPTGAASEADPDPDVHNEGAQRNLTPEEQRTFVQLLTKVYGPPPDNNQ